MGFQLQKKIRLWWDNNPMTYDWKKSITSLEGSREFFDEIDQRFFSAAFYAQNPREKPFSGLIDYISLPGKNILEIGCGAGSHTRLLAEAGCYLTTIDMSRKAVELTKKRLSIFRLNSNILQADAEMLPFADNSFDFIWSWGVIHHSSNPMIALSEMCRVLRPGGRVSFMVYHRKSLCYWVNIFLVRGILMGKIFTNTMEELANRYSDGVVARYYTMTEVASELTKYCKGIKIQVFGQFTEILPFPDPLRGFLISLMPRSLKERILSRYGCFLFATGIKKEDIRGL